jgi:isomerase DpgB
VVTAAGIGDLVLRVDGSEPVSPATVEAVLDLCDRAEDGYTHGLLTVFVSGAPRPGWTTDVSVGLITKWERAVHRLERLGLVTVAVTEGPCGGTALDLLLAADIRIAVAGTELVVPVSGDATWPGMALYRLSRLGVTAGMRRAALLGTAIDAERAAAGGLLDVVVDRTDDILAEVAAVAAGLSGREVAIRRQLMFDAGERSFEEALGSHLAACDRTLRRAAAS